MEPSPCALVLFNTLPSLSSLSLHFALLPCLNNSSIFTSLHFSYLIFHSSVFTQLPCSLFLFYSHKKYIHSLFITLFTSLSLSLIHYCSHQIHIFSSSISSSSFSNQSIEVTTLVPSLSLFLLYHPLHSPLSPSTFLLSLISTVLLFSSLLHLPQFPLSYLSCFFSLSSSFLNIP